MDRSAATGPGSARAARRDLTKGAIGGHILALSVPESVGLFFQTMFNVVDTWFAGQIATKALSALSASFPVFFTILVAGRGIGIGATAVVGNALGSGDEERARLLSRQVLSFGVFVGALVTVVGLVSQSTLFEILGASGQYKDMCMEYMTVIFCGSMFFVMNFMLNAVLNAHGDTTSYRNFLIIGATLNLALDPWFIFGGAGVPAMGIGGIGLATVVIQAIGTVYLAHRAHLHTGLFDDCRAADFIPRRDAFIEIAHQGLPASGNMLTVGLGIFVITYFAGVFGPDTVAAYGVGTRVEQIVLLPTIGLSTAVLATVSQNAGAGHYDRVRETLFTALRYGAVVMCLGTVLLFFSRGVLMRLFTDDENVVAIGSHYLGIAAFLLYSYVVLFASVAALQGLKKPLFAIIIGITRQVVVPMALFWTVVHVLDTGAGGIWWSIFAINWIAAGVSFVFARRVLSRMATTQEKPGHPSP